LHKAASAASDRQFSKANRIPTKQRLGMTNDTLEPIVMCRESRPVGAALLGSTSEAVRKMAHRHGDARAALGELALRMLPSRGGEKAWGGQSDHVPRRVSTAAPPHRRTGAPRRDHVE
jgi:hypothetical protein